MALEKTVTQDKIEIVGEFKIIQIREVVRITEDGEEVSTNYHRRTINPLDDASNESQEIRDIVATMHTQAIKDAYQAHIEASTNGE
tara:strand:- start:2826 stop:3083 length:258 start_codon:yes stop_codon:yes gene_type:complete